MVGKLIMIIEGVIIAGLIAGLVMIHESSQTKIKLLEDEKYQLNQSSQSKIKSLDDGNKRLIEENEGLSYMLGENKYGKREFGR